MAERKTRRTIARSITAAALGVLGVVGGALFPASGHAAGVVDPCGDFLAFSCPVTPDGGGRPGRSLATNEQELARRKRAAFRRNLERAQARDAAAPAQRALADFYAACIDTGAVEAAGREPILPLLTKAGSVRNPDTFLRFVGEFHAVGIEPLFRLRIEPDPDHPDKYAAQLAPGALALGEPAAYVDDAPDRRALRDAFVRHVRRLFEALGQAPAMAESNADSVLRFETALARAQLAPGAPSDAKETTRRVPRAELDRLTPGLTWHWYLLGSETEAIPEFVVADPGYFRAMAETIATLRIEALQSYLRWQVLEHAGARLPAAFAEEAAAFARIAHPPATAAPVTRAERCAQETETVLGELFANEGLEQATSLVEAVRRSVVEMVAEAAWLDRASKSERLRRLDALQLLIGVPQPGDSKASDAATALPAISGGGYARNVMLAFHWRFRRAVARIGQDVERRAGPKPASAAEIRYDAARNALSVPAAVLQPPYFDPEAGLGPNYAGLGAAVGAELIRAIVSAGAPPQVSPDSGAGRPRRVAQSYAKRLDCLSGLGRALAPAAGPADDPAELFAVAGGLRAALRAWRRQGSGNSEPLEPGLAGEREFFVSFAAARCAALPAEARAAPSGRALRVALSASEEFGRAFACRPGSPGRPKKSCPSW